MQKIALNLGCGADYRKSTGDKKWINVDNLSEYPNARIDKNVDLDRFPYPFRPGYFDEIYCNHVLEHLKEPSGALRELHRIMKPGALLILNVPYFTRGYAVHVHWHGFSIWSVLEDTRGLFEPVSIRLVWEDPKNFSRMGLLLRPFCRLWNWVLNRNHWFSERFLAYSFGGIFEARFVLRRK